MFTESTEDQRYLAGEETILVTEKLAEHLCSLAEDSLKQAWAATRLLARTHMWEAFERDKTTHVIVII